MFTTGLVSKHKLERTRAIVLSIQIRISTHVNKFSLATQNSI